MICRATIKAPKKREEGTDHRKTGDEKGCEEVAQVQDREQKEADEQGGAEGRSVEE